MLDGKHVLICVEYSTTLQITQRLFIGSGNGIEPQDEVAPNARAGSIKITRFMALTVKIYFEVKLEDSLREIERI